VNLLPDTHVVLWWLGDDRALGARARQALADPANTVYLSAVVVWEMRIKQAIGKLDLPDDFAEVLAEQAFVDLPVTVRHAHAVADLPMHHRDPFDRMLVAQARTEGLHLVTQDPLVARYDVPVLPL
jgi:PIN domain nuclease of toxin-antitoxin system